LKPVQETGTRPGDSEDPAGGYQGDAEQAGYSRPRIEAAQSAAAAGWEVVPTRAPGGWWSAAGAARDAGTPGKKHG
jgi:hypothetical protein